MELGILNTYIYQFKLNQDKICAMKLSCIHMVEYVYIKRYIRGIYSIHISETPHNLKEGIPHER